MPEFTKGYINKLLFIMENNPNFRAPLAERLRTLEHKLYKEGKREDAILVHEAVNELETLEDELKIALNGG